MRKRYIAILIVAVSVFIFGSSVFSQTQKKKDNLFKSVDLFSDVVTIIRSEYFEDIDSKNLIYGALKGMLSSLDAYSQFLSPEDYKDLQVETEGRFGGIGIEITLKDDLITVITPIEDTPAWKAGIKTNDRIVKINNELTRGMTINDAVKRLRGKPKEAVVVVVLRESEKKLIEFKIVRDIIRIRDVKEARILQDGVGYIRLVEFRENTASELDRALENLNKEGLNALILDLRYNPGGLLDVAVRAAEKFIEKDKIIVSTKGRKETQSLKFVSRFRNPSLDFPMVVLINEGSASGSEIVAGCLQDYKRAIIMGTKSFGKGSVQTVIPLSDGSAIRLTTSKYFTPLGRMIHGKGIEPDITVEEVKIDTAGKKEVDQAEKTQEVFNKLESKEKKIEEKIPVFDYKNDTQIMHAVDVLKAIRLYKETGKKQ